MLKHTLLYLGVRALNGLLALATLALLSRWLSAEDYGRWALGQTLVGSAALLLFQWAHTAYGRLHSLGPALDATLLRLWALLALLPLSALPLSALLALSGGATLPLLAVLALLFSRHGPGSPGCLERTAAARQP